MSKEQEEREILDKIEEWNQTLKRQPHRRGSIETHKAELNAQLTALRQGMGATNEFTEVRERQRPRRASLEPVSGSIAASVLKESAFEDEDEEEGGDEGSSIQRSSSDQKEPTSSRGQQHIAEMMTKLEAEIAQYDKLKKQQPHRRPSIESKQENLNKKLEELRQGMGVDSELRRVVGGGRRRRASLEPKVSGIPEGFLEENDDDRETAGASDTGIRGLREIDADIREELERYEKGQEESGHAHSLDENLQSRREAMHQGRGEEGEMERVIGGGRRRRASMEPTEAQILETFQEDGDEEEEGSDKGSSSGSSSTASNTRGHRGIKHIEEEILAELRRHDQMMIDEPHRKESIQKSKDELNARLEALRQGQGEEDEMDRVIGGGRRRRASLEPGDARIPQSILESGNEEEDEDDEVSENERVRKASYPSGNGPSSHKALRGASGGGIVVSAGTHQVISPRRDSGGAPVSTPQESAQRQAPQQSATTGSAIAQATGEQGDGKPDPAPSSPGSGPELKEKKGICHCVVM